MGNHDVGRAMSAGAKGFWAGAGNRIVDQPEALAVLDEIANDFRGADAEFDDELHEETPLSRLVAIAFDATPDEIADLKGEFDGGRVQDRGELWYDGPITRFRKRYDFC